MATDALVRSRAPRLAKRSWPDVPLGADAWLAIAATVAFVAISSWWLSRDHSIPIFDAGLHLRGAIETLDLLRAGHVGAALTLTYPYPPLVFLVGALGLWVGGLGVSPPILALNIVFVPLLALGCYHTGRLAFGSRAGLVAVVIALGSPLIAAQFHVFMVDAPETAMVAVAVWLILASDGFSRAGRSAAAGVAVGLGMLTKEPFVFFVAGVLATGLVRAGMRALRGDWRSLRGLSAFALPALAIPLPWYIHFHSQVQGLAHGSVTTTGGSTGYAGIAPPRFSGQNLTWYFWNIAKYQLYAPLFALALIGGCLTIVGLARRRSTSPLSWDLLVGAFVAWVGITETFVHDVRYSMPLLVYLAVFAAGWLVRLPRTPRLLAIGLVIALAVANTLAISFGVGRTLDVRLFQGDPNLMQGPGVLTISSTSGFPVGRPYDDGNVLGLMRTLRRDGIRAAGWLNLGKNEPPPLQTAIFSKAGLRVLARIAGLEVIPTEAWEEEPSERRVLTKHDAFLGHGPVERGEAPPCVKLSDGSGVWVRLGNPNAHSSQDYCPYRHPAFYGS